MRMFVRMLETIGTELGVYLAGETYEPSDAIAASFVRSGAARLTAEPPETIQRLLARLEIGAGQRVLFLPFCGEFGHQVLTHLRIVHFSRAAYKIVCCRPGEQVLYPDADEFFTDWENPVPDLRRIGSMRERTIDWPGIIARFPDAIPLPAGELTLTQELHCIHAGERIEFHPRRRGLYAEILLGIRVRQFMPERNWPHWQAIADALSLAGRTFGVVAARETSHDVGGQQFHTGDYDADATIEALKNCRLYVGTDTGISHLAATVGVPMLIFRTSAGHTRDMTEQMRQRNPGRVTVLPESAWRHPSDVVEGILRTLEAPRPGRRDNAEIDAIPARPA